MTRAFRLINADGVKIDLLADLDIFGISPEGLGVSFDYTSHLSNSNYLLEKSEVNQNEFKLSVAFGYISHDPYNAYMKLAQFLDRAPYKLEYETPAGIWVRETRLKGLTKSEIVSGDIMMEDFTLSCFTPWYRIVENRYDPVEDVAGDGKIYRWYDHTDATKTLYAFAYSKDGKEGFTTKYPQDNMLTGLVPYDRSTQIMFATNDTANGKWIAGQDTITLSNVVDNKWTQFVMYSTDTAYVGINATPGLKAITPGNVYTMSCKFTPTSDISSSMIVNMALSFIDTDGRMITLSAKNIRGDSLVKDQTYYYNVTSDSIPESITTARYVRLAVTFQGPGTVVVSDVKIEPGTEATGTKGLPTYLGTREVTQNYPDNVNISRKQDIVPLGPVTKIDYSSWQGIGAFIVDRGSDINGGTYLYSRSLLKANTQYYMKFKMVSPITGLRSFILYNIYNDLSSFELKIDGDVVNKGFGTTSNDIYWLVDQSNPDQADKVEHIIELKFTLGATIAPSNNYNSIILQFNKGLDISTSVQISELMLVEGDHYDGPYTQEELYNFYSWSALDGRWEQPKPDGSFLDLVYPHVYDYAYGQLVPNPEGPAMAAYTYDYIYEGFANGANGVFQVHNESVYMNGQKGSPVEIYIDGPAKNPYWQVIKDGVIVDSDGFNIELAEGTRLVVSSIPGEQRAELIASDGTKSNVYQQQRLELDNFITIPPGYSTVAFFNAKLVGFNMREERVLV